MYLLYLLLSLQALTIRKQIAIHRTEASGEVKHSFENKKKKTQQTIKEKQAKKHKKQKKTKQKSGLTHKTKVNTNKKGQKYKKTQHNN